MKILELELPTNNLEQTERFYRDVLKLKAVDFKSNSVSFSLGHSVLRFIEDKDKNINYHFALNIPKNKTDEALIWISAKLDPIKNSEGNYRTDFNDWNAESVYFFDNNKNILEFIARHDLDNASDQPFNENSILSISEVGVVTDEPLVLAEKFVNEEGLFYFEKGPKREDFVVLGDDNGLIVISRLKRNWYPTDQPAELHKLKMKIEIGSSVRPINVAG